jgi:hypothetical protein
LRRGPRHGHERRSRDILDDMQALKAHVRSGHIVVDEPISLPEGTELYLVPSDNGDDLDAEERAELHQAIEESERELDAGKVVSEEEIWAMLRAIK